MKNTEVRDILGEQLRILLERSRQDIPLIALDGLSSEMAKIGRVLLDDGGDERISLREMVGAAQRKTRELMMELAGKGLSGADVSWQEMCDRLDEIHALLSRREGGA